jgi:hypothetical protein
MSRRPLRLALAVVLGAAAAVAPVSGHAGTAPGAESTRTWRASDYARVDIAPTKTSIYIGTVSMTMPAFVRHEDRYESTYAAKVFPYFFYNEQGTLAIDLPETALRRLAAGETVEFSGRAHNTAREERRVEGKATPTDARSGKLKVRVFVTKRIELIFNTTYVFPAVPAPAAGAGAPPSPTTPPDGPAVPVPSPARIP